MHPNTRQNSLHPSDTLLEPSLKRLVWPFCLKKKKTTTTGERIMAVRHSWTDAGPAGRHLVEGRGHLLVPWVPEKAVGWTFLSFSFSPSSLPILWLAFVLLCSQFHVLSSPSPSLAYPFFYLSFLIFLLSLLPFCPHSLSSFIICLWPYHWLHQWIWKPFIHISNLLGRDNS